MSLNNDDFDEDVDDILLSDDETIKKPKKNVNLLKKDSDVPKANASENEKPVINGNNSHPTNVNKVYKSTLFEDDHDPLAMIDVQRNPHKPTPDLNKKGAKSVLDSLLNPISELDDFSFNKNISKSMESNAVEKNMDNINDKKQTIDDDFLKSSKYRPSTGVPQIKNSTENSGNKRTVRFSTEGNLDSDFDGADSVRLRPKTAPSTSSEVAKTKFISRFEEAEIDDVLLKHSDIKFNNESEPSLWNSTNSNDFQGSSTSRNKVRKTDEDIESKNKDGNTRTSAKQKLSEFLQTTTEDVFSKPISKTQYSPGDQSSNEDITFPGKPAKFDEAYSNRRSSVQAERPRTGYGRSSSSNQDTRRRSSIQVDASFEKLRTGYELSDGLDLEYGTRHNVQTNGHVQLKEIQSERDDLLYKLEGIVKRNKEEIEIIERSYKNRIELTEDNMQRKEKRFKEEIEFLSQQNKQKLQMLEDERMEMRSELSRRQDEIENQKRNEIIIMKEQHKLEFDKLKNNHDDLIERLRHAKSEEDSTIRLAQPTTAQLQSVLTQVSNGAYDLASLKQQLSDQMNLQIKEKDVELKLKTDSLRQLEEHLNAQKDENYKERERLQSLISTLDIQLKDQAKKSDEERWYLRQEQNKLAALQLSLDKEREHLLIEKDQNRASHEEFRTKLLEEQKQLFDKLYDEKRSLAEERAKLTREVSKWSESSQFTNVKKNQESAELEGIRSALAEERRELESMRSKIVKEREENIQKLSQINSLEYDLRLKSEKLNQQEMELISKQSIIDEKEKHCRKLDMDGEDALKKAKTIQNSHQEQLSTIQKQLLILADKEKHIHTEEIELEKRRSTVVKQDKSFVCSKCSNVLRDSAIGGSLNDIHTMSVLGISKEPANRRYESYLNPDLTNSIEYSHHMVGKMEEERLINSIRRAADEDRDYLENERAYLRSLAMTQDQYLRNQVRS